MKAGDIVVLKSGGPRMTVKSIHDTTVNVVWFEGFKEQFGNERTTSFPEHCLKLAK